MCLWTVICHYIILTSSPFLFSIHLDVRSDLMDFMDIKCGKDDRNLIDFTKDLNLLSESLLIWHRYVENITLLSFCIMRVGLKWTDTAISASNLKLWLTDIIIIQHNDMLMTHLLLSMEFSYFKQSDFKMLWLPLLVYETCVERRAQTRIIYKYVLYNGFIILFSLILELDENILHYPICDNLNKNLSRDMQLIN